MIKFVFSEKATTDEIFTIDLTLTYYISSIFVAFLENMNFTGTGGRGGQEGPQYFADQLTLFQLGEGKRSPMMLGFCMVFFAAGS